MTLIMAKYHFNVYPIATDDFSYARDLLDAYYSEFDSRFPYCYGDFFSNRELKLMLKSLPENCCYMVRRSILEGFKTVFTVWILPFSSCGSAVFHLINHDVIQTNICSRDVGYYDLSDTLDDIPYNYHYIIQRYYD